MIQNKCCKQHPPLTSFTNANVLPWLQVWIQFWFYTNCHSSQSKTLGFARSSGSVNPLSPWTQKNQKLLPHNSFGQTLKLVSFHFNFAARTLGTASWVTKSSLESPTFKLFSSLLKEQASHAGERKRLSFDRCTFLRLFGGRYREEGPFHCLHRHFSPPPPNWQCLCFLGTMLACVSDLRHCQKAWVPVVCFPPRTWHRHSSTQAKSAR